MARNRRAQADPEVAETSDDGLTPVRTTINPHEVIRVGDAELLDLKRQGLIYEGDDLAEPDADEGTQVPSGVITDPPPPGDGDDDKQEGGEGE